MVGDKGFGILWTDGCCGCFIVNGLFGVCRQVDDNTKNCIKIFFAVRACYMKGELFFQILGGITDNLSTNVQCGLGDPCPSGRPLSVKKTGRKIGNKDLSRQNKDLHRLFCTWRRAELSGNTTVWSKLAAIKRYLCKIRLENLRTVVSEKGIQAK
ncbi:hypothetical protein L873DRAFT_502829 [Choiromyces venosus 120613-1]|uniref:Uncharacterized protein n=1 Tax=Choiromyces venosus 120613-1 TaxID=1336337 RepID=A0A3N4IYP0_9PEZI|nr:hypothetical protein L873DRAFT_502829 [Choiromyces venosus 120613-1]